VALDPFGYPRRFRVSLESFGPQLKPLKLRILHPGHRPGLVGEVGGWLEPTGMWSSQPRAPDAVPPKRGRITNIRCKSFPDTRIRLGRWLVLDVPD
jgi:hypothetical protein